MIILFQRHIFTKRWTHCSYSLKKQKMFQKQIPTPASPILWFSLNPYNSLQVEGINCSFCEISPREIYSERLVAYIRIWIQESYVREYTYFLFFRPSEVSALLTIELLSVYSQNIQCLMSRQLWENMKTWYTSFRNPCLFSGTN